jgi:hypothetical protein
MRGGELAYSTVRLSEPAAADRLGIGFGWLQNAWLLHARLKIHRGGIDPRSVASTENPRAGSLSLEARLGEPVSRADFDAAVEGVAE